MRTPTWFRQRLSNLGPLVLQKDRTADEAADEITDAVLRDRHFLRGITREFVLRKLALWITTHRVDSAVADDGQCELFPNLKLPKLLETSPGRFADVAVMTRRDWNNAVKQAQTKVDNASGFLDKVEAARDLVEPLLVNDDLTTADVWPPKQQMALVGT